MKTLRLSSSDEDLKTAGEIIRRGGLVAFPTETVYGLGANAFDEKAAKNIFRAKGRPADNPLIVHIADKKDIAEIVSDVPPKAKKLIDAFFPAPLTVIMKKSEKIPLTVSAGLDTVGVRMPQNETARRFIKAAGVPIAAPSANKSGRPSPTDARYVLSDMDGEIDAVIEGGQCSIGVESTVISMVGDIPVILRPGAVTKEQIEKVVGEVRLAKAVKENVTNETVRSPGMKYKHYAPKAEVVLVKGSASKFKAFTANKKGAMALCFEEDEVAIPRVTYGRQGDDESQAKALFSSLRHLDELGAEKVYAHCPSETGVGLAVYNRMIRAAAFRIIDLEKPFLIGLTGQTGAGKGYVAKTLKELGFNVLDADLISHQITDEPAVLGQLQAAFGSDIAENGKLNRALLAERAFESSEGEEKLNKITHPAIIDAAVRAAEFPAVFDAALLFESGADKLCAVTIAVTAPEELRLKRIMARDGISEETALLRMNAQQQEEYYKTKANAAVINDGRDIKTQINKVLGEIL